MTISNRSYEENLAEFQELIRQVESGKLTLDGQLEAIGRGKLLAEELTSQLNGYAEKMAG